MEETLFKILDILKASPADYFIFGMGMVVVLWIVLMSKRIKLLEQKYHLLNLSNVRLWDRVDPDMVRDHYSGDYSIRNKSIGKVSPKPEVAETSERT